MLCTASATQSENVEQKPKSECSSIRINCSTNSSTCPAATEASIDALELTTVNGNAHKSHEKNGVAISNANKNTGASQQSALDELLARVDREQNAIDQNFEEDTVRALAEVLLNQVCLILILVLVDISTMQWAVRTMLMRAA